jgi:hydroxymethylbilane synthase
LHHPATALTVSAERSFLRRLNGGCQVPLAAHGTLAGQTLNLTGLVAGIDGRCLLKETVAASLSQAEELGVHLAEKLLSKGADRILAALDIRPKPLGS